MKIKQYAIVAALFISWTLHGQVELHQSRVADRAVLSWTNSTVFFDLQTTERLASNAWVLATNDVSWASNRYFATNALDRASHFFRLASRHPFLGEFTREFQKDSNISDGLNLTRADGSFTVNQQSSNEFTIGIFGAQIPTILVGTRLANQTRPFEISDALVLDTILLSDGANKVFTVVTQEKDNPLDVAVRVSSWTEAEGMMTPADLVGTWHLEGFSDSNLRSTADGFGQRSSDLLVADLGDGIVSLTFPGRFTCRARVTGMTAVLLDAPVNTGDSYLHALKVASNSMGLSLYFVATELNDASDVSVFVGLGMR